MDNEIKKSEIAAADAEASIDATVPHKRRVRYKSTHPRKFSEKYKEHNPGSHQSEIDKVKARGQTPAGMHIPICVNEILAAFELKPGQIGVDATLGYGGHAQEILKLLGPEGKLFGLDIDPVEMPRTEARLRNLGFSENVFQVKRMNFAGILSLLGEVPQGFDFVLADLGVSSMQIDTPERGFSFKALGPLDLRLNPQKGMSAQQLITSVTVPELQQILSDNADEPEALRLAKAIIREKDLIKTTFDLATTVRNAMKSANASLDKKEIKKTTQRVFQALRIAVNREFEVLEEFLERVPRCLKSGGKLAILSFHSGEDRRVKKSFQNGALCGIYSDVSESPLRPTGAEQRANPRSSCAKLRIAVKA